jgi:hypothetical protein
MKYIFFFLFVPFSTFCQDCKTLNQMTSFKGINLGRPLPQSIKKYFKKSDNFYFLKDDINLEASVSYHDFNGFYFQNMALDLLNDSIICSISIWSSFDAIDSQQIKNHQPVLKYINLAREITELFGDSTRTEEKYDEYSSLFGTDFKTVWQCDKIKIELTITYGSTTKELNNIAINFVSTEFEKKKKLQQLSR